MSKQYDRLTLLETFIRIADSKSLTIAASDLDISQATASRQLKVLEDLLGLHLIHRSTHALSCIPAGHELLVDSREMLNRWQQLEDHHTEAAHSIAGSLKVVAPLGMGQVFLTELCVQFQIDNPGVTLTWQLCNKEIHFGEVGCDVWIRLGDIPDESLIVRQLAISERLLVAAPSLLNGKEFRTPAQVEKLPCIALESREKGVINLTSAKGQMRTIRPVVRMTTNNFFSLHQAVTMGLGFAVLPRWFVDQDIKEGTLVEVLSSWLAESLPFSVAYLSARYQPKLITAFVETLTSEVSQLEGMQPVEKLKIIN